MTWENILKMNIRVWKEFVVKLLQQAPHRSWTTREILDNLIDNSTISGATDRGPKRKLKYKNVPPSRTLTAFLVKDNRFRIIEGKKKDEYIWDGEE